MTAPPLSIMDLTVTVQGTAIVDGVYLTIQAGEIVGLVGESGSGKSLTCLAAMGLLTEPLQARGDIRVAGTDISILAPGKQRELRGNVAAMVFQEPMSSLNPTLRVGTQLDEALRHKGMTDRLQRRRRAVELLDQVGINPPAERLRQYPHELSGGMCQRIMIAIALAGGPRLLIADEPTTALDVTIQAQILDLLQDLVRRSGMSLLLVSHDMGVVAQTCERVCVMYAGRIVESGPVRQILSAPEHPYTEALLRSMPTVDGPRHRLSSIPGSVPLAGGMPTGCRFHPRCPLVQDRCREQVPQLSTTGGQSVACWVRGRST